MPSWNIHTAHVERLLADESLADLGIARPNDFVFGNLVPDVYVGYVVPDVSHVIAYKDTHLADPGFIPTPNAALFYERYVRDTANDVTLGAWTHLICDHYYNLRTIEYIASIGVEPGEQTRIRKQGDFDLFGRTLDIRWVPESTSELLRLCADFPQYPIDEADVQATIRAQAGIVRKNSEQHVWEEPGYSLLTADFFATTFAEVDALLRDALHLHASGGDPTSVGRA